MTLFWFPSKNWRGTSTNGAWLLVELDFWPVIGTVQSDSRCLSLATAKSDSWEHRRLNLSPPTFRWCGDGEGESGPIESHRSNPRKLQRLWPSYWVCPGRSTIRPSWCPAWPLSWNPQVPPPFLCFLFVSLFCIDGLMHYCL